MSLPETVARPKLDPDQPLPSDSTVLEIREGGGPLHRLRRNKIKPSQEATARSVLNHTDPEVIALRVVTGSRHRRRVSTIFAGGHHEGDGKVAIPRGNRVTLVKFNLRTDTIVFPTRPM